MSSILATYDIAKPRDKNGQEVDPDLSFHSGLLYHLNPFKCTLQLIFHLNSSEAPAGILLWKSSGNHLDSTKSNCS